MLARFFIDRPVFAWVISIVIVLVGWMSLVSLPIAQYPGDHAADDSGRLQLSRRQRPGRRRHRRGADRAADQRRREHDVHVVAVQQRRLVQPDRHLQARRRSGHRPGAGAKPRVAGAADAARRRQGDRRHGQETIAQHSPGRQPLFRHRPGDRQALLRSAPPEQLRDHPDQRCAGPRGRRRRRAGVRPAGLQHARLARSRQAVVAQPHGQRRDQGAARAERPGGGRTDRPTAGAERARLPVHHGGPGPADGAEAVRQHRRQDRARTGR